MHQTDSKIKPIHRKLPKQCSSGLETLSLKQNRNYRFTNSLTYTFYENKKKETKRNFKNDNQFFEKLHSERRERKEWEQ